MYTQAIRVISVHALGVRLLHICVHLWSVAAFAGSNIFDCSQYLIDIGMKNSVAAVELPPLNISSNEAMNSNQV